MVSSSLFWEVHLLKKIPLTPKPFWECIPWVILGIYLLVMAVVVAVLTYSNHFLTCFYMLEQQRILSVIVHLLPLVFQHRNRERARHCFRQRHTFHCFLFFPASTLGHPEISLTPASLQTSFAIRNKAPDQWFFKQHWQTSHGDAPILITHLNKVKTNSDVLMKIQAFQSSLLLGATQDTSKTSSVSTLIGLDAAWHYMVRWHFPACNRENGSWKLYLGVNWLAWVQLDGYVWIFDVSTTKCPFCPDKMW